jgi:DNA-directed RNA polymerase II subunit RPB1
MSGTILLVIVNMITRNGTLTPLNRHGLNKLDIGPLVKCTFEETVEVLFDAALFAEKNSICSIADNIMVGQRFHGGTGLVELKMDDKHLQPPEVIEPVYREDLEIVRTYYSEFAACAEETDLRVVIPSAPTSPAHTAPTSPVYQPRSPTYAENQEKADGVCYVPSSPRLCCDVPSSPHFL